jgi:hypothetical protein
VTPTPFFRARVEEKETDRTSPNSSHGENMRAEEVSNSKAGDISRET